jgi:hypothetical protein
MALPMGLRPTRRTRLAAARLAAFAAGSREGRAVPSLLLRLQHNQGAGVPRSTSGRHHPALLVCLVVCLLWHPLA